MTHPRYLSAGKLRINHPDQLLALIGDEVVEQLPDDPSAGTVVAIYQDGMVELSSGDQVPAADLVLIKRAQ